ncbi:MAG: metallophosphoesterase [Anaerolineae bacterium]|nr:metallophosphoesterase [Phycisphaerae bacterium]
MLATADLHYNHHRSKPLADELIDEMNRLCDQSHIDALLLVGDTAVADGDSLEQCLSRIRFAGEKIFVAGNHELWTRSADSYEIFRDILPQRVRALGWRWLEDDPFVAPDRSVAIVGSVGWYDYSFAIRQLGIPLRFYEQKVSPGAAARLSQFDSLLIDSSDVPPNAMEIVARWNDGKFVKLHRSDKAFLEELLANLQSQLDALHDVPHLLAAIHHVPFDELLPPKHGSQWDFVRAYLGSRRVGELLRRYPNVRDVICGHSHFQVEAMIGNVRAINIGSGYRTKTYRVIELA